MILENDQRVIGHLLHLHGKGKKKNLHGLTYIKMAFPGNFTHFEAMSYSSY